MGTVVHFITKAFYAACGGYLSYALITVLYDKFYSKRVTWFNMRTFYKVNNVWFKIWLIGSVFVLIDLVLLYMRG